MSNDLNDAWMSGYRKGIRELRVELESQWTNAYAKGYADGVDSVHTECLAAFAREKDVRRRHMLRLRWRATSDRRTPEEARFDEDMLFRRVPYDWTGRAANIGLRRDKRPIYGPKGFLP